MNKLASADDIRPSQTPEPIIVNHDPKVDEMLGFVPPNTVPPVPKHQFPTEIIDLPSRGLIYPEGHPLSNGTVEIKYMTALEEDILTTQSYIKKGIVLDKLCEAIIVTPKVKFDDILVGDKNAILMAARAYGYGPIYETSIKTESGNSIPVNINLLDLPHKVLDESLVTRGVNRFKFVLPKSQKTVEFKLLTNGDQKGIDAEIARYSKSNIHQSTHSLTLRLRRMIISVDGNESPEVISPFVANMLALDSKALREYISSIQPDVDISVEEVDPETGETFRGNFEIGINLFYPDYKK